MPTARLFAIALITCLALAGTVSRKDLGDPTANFEPVLGTINGRDDGHEIVPSQPDRLSSLSLGISYYVRNMKSTCMGLCYL